MQQIARVRRDQCRAQDLIRTFGHENFGKTAFFAFNHRAIDFFERNDKEIVFHISLPRFLFAQPDVGDFRLGVSAPRHDGPIHFLPQKLEWHQDVSNNDPRSEIGRMREFEAVGDISRCIDMRL